MIQLNILSGKMAGGQTVARHFPFQIGRAAGNQLQLEDDGVWDKHISLEFQRRTGFHLKTAAGAFTMVNNAPVQDTILRNGDTITLGSAKLQFWLAAARQSGLRGRESFVWAMLLVVTLGQLVLLYWLIR